MHYSNNRVFRWDRSYHGAFPVCAVALMGLASTACGSANGGEEGTDTPSDEQMGDFPEEMLPERVVPDLPLVAPESELDIPVFSDVIEMEPSADVTFCTYTDVILEEPMIFGESFGSQSPHGHHSILQYTTTPVEPGTRRCGVGEEEMEMSGMLLGGTGGKSIANEAYLPPNYGVEIPAGAQLIINHHWINTSTDFVEGQAMMLARRLEEGGDTVLAGTFPVVGVGWEIPAQGSLEYTTECKYEEDVAYVMTLGHMHEYGDHVRIEVDREDGTTENVIDQEWTEELATGSSGQRIYSLEDPLRIRAGETVRLTCSWNNDTDEPVGFPREMCIFFGYTIGQSYVCGNGYWLTPEQAAAAGTGMGDIVSHL